MSQSRIRDLHVYTNESGSNVELPSSSTRYRIVEAAIHLALSLLESPQGRRSLVDVSKAILDNAGQRGHIYRDSLDNLPAWIDRFLKSIRNDCPGVYIDTTVKGEAYARRVNWGNDMQKYEAGQAVTIYIHNVLIDNMVYSRQHPEITENSYEMFKFQLGLVLAHEIIHCLTGFLLGTTSDTPPNVTLDRYGDTKKGEAGRMWEKRLLGGVVEMWSSPQDGLGKRQAGTPYLFDGGRQHAIGRRVSVEYINNFIKEGFSFPIATSIEAPATTRTQLSKEQSKETSALRTKRSMKNAPAASSPPPGASSSSTSYRRLPIESQATASQAYQETVSQRNQKTYDRR
ncbi:hypothetical protein PG996_007838 [Apiospora saccharicola]|uniref:SprT-like domain-containing protein n=1 Tax=Apiospora saccharicola TaxID=335842 RepID=A0ABR1UYR1_9PEZI